MTPAEFFYGALYIGGGCVILAVSLVLLGVCVVGFIAAAGWLVSTFKQLETVAAVSQPRADANGQAVRIVRFPTGQTGTVPYDSPLPESFTQ
jgi:hypothetical protein